MRFWSSVRASRAVASSLYAGAVSAQRLALGEEGRTLGHAALVGLADGLHPLARALEVLLVVGDGQRGRVMAIAQVLERVLSGHQRGLGRLAAGSQGLDLAVEARHLGVQLADLPHA